MSLIDLERSLRWLAGDNSGKFSEGDKQVLLRAAQLASIANPQQGDKGWKIEGNPGAMAEIKYITSVFHGKYGVNPEDCPCCPECDQPLWAGERIELQVCDAGSFGSLLRLVHYDCANEDEDEDDEDDED